MVVRKNARILVVDDEVDILDFIEYNLNKEGYDVKVCSDSTKALDIASQIEPDLVLLDIMMPKLDGVELCKILRKEKKFKETMISFLTARGEDFSEIAALEAGGDDYIVKPIRLRSFLSRIRALLRRSPGRIKKDNDDHIISILDLELNKERFEFKKSGELIILAKKEFEILWLLISRPGKVFSREEIFNNIWGADVIVGERTIDVHIRKLREKIGENYIKTIKGLGYKLDA